MSTLWALPGTLAVIGGGRMGEAIVAGLLASGAVEASAVVVAEPSASRRVELSAAHGVRCVAAGIEALPSDTVIVAVKPQVMDDVIRSLAPCTDGSLIVSIAAGVSTARLESQLPAGASVVRVMPNTPALVGAGMALVSGGSSSTAAQVDLVRSLFASIGEALVIDERLQDAGTAISGSGPAYFALVIDALARAGVRHGLSRDVAQELAIRTMEGTARQLTVTGVHPEALVDAVSSPGGTTIAAIGELEHGRMRDTIGRAVSAAVLRASELGGGA